MDGVPEAAGVQQASGDGGVEVAESQGYASEGRAFRYGSTLCSNTHMVSSADLLSVRIVNMNRSPSFLT